MDKTTTWLVRAASIFIIILGFGYIKNPLGNKLKLLTGENQGIQKICSWKRRITKNLSKIDLLNYDSDLTQKYITKKKSVIRFRVNDYRPYPFT